MKNNEEMLEQLLRDGSRCGHTENYCRDCKHYGTHKVGRCNWEAATAEMLNDQGVVVLRWISAADHLPEDGQEIIASDGKKIIRDCFFEEGDFWKPDSCADDVYEQFYGVTHWMPCPELQQPKEK